MSQTLNQYLLRVGVFLALVFIIVVLLYPVLQEAFLSNIFINLIILLALAVGIIFNIVKLIDLNSDFSSLVNFDINKSSQSFTNNSGNLKNITEDLKPIDGRFVFKSTSISRLIENTDMALSSVRETSRYLVGLLVFLGLLGTFWGLLKTIGSVGNVISGLGIDDTNVAGFFNSLKDGLNAPLQGMSIAFSSSLLGLAGSLILGFIDINLGCPVKKVVKKGCGAALLRDPAYLEKFLTIIKKGIRIPLTVKMRTGWNEEELTIHECVQAAYNSGCEWVAIHGRTRAQGYEGKADWNLIAEVKANAKIPVIGNGDIRNAEQARRRLAESKVDAVMIGRGALRNPGIFNECIGLKTDISCLNIIRRYQKSLKEYYDTRFALIMLRKFSAWLAFGNPGAAKFRKSMFDCLTSAEVMEKVEAFFQNETPLPFNDNEKFMMGGHG